MRASSLRTTTTTDVSMGRIPTSCGWWQLMRVINIIHFAASSRGWVLAHDRMANIFSGRQKSSNRLSKEEVSTPLLILWAAGNDNSLLSLFKYQRLILVKLNGTWTINVFICLSHVSAWDLPSASVSWSKETEACTIIFTEVFVIELSATSIILRCRLGGMYSCMNLL